MEEDCPDIVQMSIECEQTSTRLIRPHLNFVVISTRDKSVQLSIYSRADLLMLFKYSQGLGLVEINAADRPVVFFEAVYQGSHAVIP